LPLVTPGAAAGLADRSYSAGGGGLGRGLAMPTPSPIPARAPGHGKTDRHQHHGRCDQSLEADHQPSGPSCGSAASGDLSPESSLAQASRLITASFVASTKLLLTAGSLVRVRPGESTLLRNVHAKSGTGPALLRHHAAQAAGDQGGDVEQDAGQGDAGRRDEVARLPDRTELRLVLAQPLEVVEMLAVAEDQGAEPRLNQR
jgi:hypothetical protein